jgi:hypothetical protein
MLQVAPFSSAVMFVHELIKCYDITFSFSYSSFTLSAVEAFQYFLSSIVYVIVESGLMILIENSPSGL